jgi:hypothetical protein
MLENMLGKWVKRSLIAGAFVFAVNGCGTDKTYNPTLNNDIAQEEISSQEDVMGEVNYSEIEDILEVKDTLYEDKMSETLVEDVGIDTYTNPCENDLFEITLDFKQAIASTKNKWIGKEELEILSDEILGKPVLGKNSLFGQYLIFENESTGFVDFLENDDDVQDYFLLFEAGKQIAKYELDLFSPLDSEIVNGTELKDFLEGKAEILGKEYSIVKASRPNENGVDLTLMRGAIFGSMSENESHEYEINNDGSITNYDIELFYVDEESVKFKVNGEMTSKLYKGDIGTLADGTLIGVSDILYQNYAGGIHAADFYLGAEAIQLKDNDITDDNFSHELKVNEESIDGAEVKIIGVDNGSIVDLWNIQLNMVAPDDFYVGVGQKLSKIIADTAEEPELLFTQNWDMRLKSYDPNTEKAVVEIGYFCPEK